MAWPVVWEVRGSARPAISLEKKHHLGAGPTLPLSVASCLGLSSLGGVLYLVYHSYSDQVCPNHLSQINWALAVSSCFAFINVAAAAGAYPSVKSWFCSYHLILTTKIFFFLLNKWNIEKQSLHHQSALAPHHNQCCTQIYLLWSHHPSLVSHPGTLAN